MATNPPSGFVLDAPPPPDGFVLDPKNGFQASEMAGNIIPSAKRYIGGMINAVIHPVQTAKIIAKTGGGAVQYAKDAIDAIPIPESAKAGAKAVIPGAMAVDMVGGAIDSQKDDLRPYADALVNMYVQRYGSMDKALQTLESDPVGVLADVSTLLGMSGMPKLSAATNPTNVAKSIVKLAIKRVVPTGYPAKLYESAAKFGTTIEPAERARITNTALKHGINLSSKGVEKLNGIIDGFNAKIDDLIAANSGQQIPRADLMRYVSDLKLKRGGVKFDAADDIAFIDSQIQKFDDHLNSQGKTWLTPAEVQQFKVDRYNNIKWNSSRMTGTPVREDLDKSLARGAKDSLEVVIPEIGETNRKLGPLYELQPRLERAASRIENRDIIGLTQPIEVTAGAAAGAGIAGEVGAMIGGTAGALSAILGIPKLKGYNAIKLQRLIDSGWIQTVMNNNKGASNAQLAAIIIDRLREEDQQTTQQSPERQAPK